MNGWKHYHDAYNDVYTFEIKSFEYTISRNDEPDAGPGAPSGRWFWTVDCKLNGYSLTSKPFNCLKTCYADFTVKSVKSANFLRREMVR